MGGLGPCPACYWAHCAGGPHRRCLWEQCTHAVAAAAGFLMRPLQRAPLSRLFSVYSRRQRCFPRTLCVFPPQCTGVVALLGIPWWWATTSGFYLQCRPPCLFLCCCCDASSAVQAEQRPHQSAPHMMCMCVSDCWDCVQLPRSRADGAATIAWAPHLPVCVCGCVEWE